MTFECMLLRSKNIKWEPKSIIPLFQLKNAGFASNNGKRRILSFQNLNLKKWGSWITSKTYRQWPAKHMPQYPMVSEEENYKCISRYCWEGKGVGWKTYPCQQADVIMAGRRKQMRHVWYEAFATWLMLKSRERLGTGVGFCRSSLFSTWFQWQNSAYGY